MLSALKLWHDVRHDLQVSRGWLQLEIQVNNLNRMIPTKCPTVGPLAALMTAVARPRSDKSSKMAVT